MHTCTRGLSGGKSPRTRARTHTGVHTHTVRSQLSTPASQLIKPNPSDWTEEFKLEPPPFLPLKFGPFQLTVAVVALYQVRHAHFVSASCAFIQCCVWPLLHLWVSHRQLRAETGNPFAWAPTLGRGKLVLNPEIVYTCKSDKNPLPNTPTRPTFVCAL